MKDEKILKYLNKNKLTSKDQLYEQFPNFSKDILDYHLNKECPYLLHEKSEDSVVKESTPKKKTPSLRQQIFKIVYKNPDITNRELYILFPDTDPAALRKAKSVALKKIDEEIIKMSTREMDNDMEKDIEKTEKVKNNIDKEKAYINNGKTDKDVGEEKILWTQYDEKPLILKKLEAKAYGTQTRCKNSTSGYGKSDYGEKQKSKVLENEIFDEKTINQSDPIKKPILLNNDELLERLIESKLASLKLDLSQVQNSLNRHQTIAHEQLGYENVAETVNAIIETKIQDKLEKIIEDKLNQIITKKLADIGGNLLGNAFSSLLSNMNLNLNFGKK